MSNRKVGVGSILGPYVITRKIGGGGAGNVFVADDRECQAQVAVKVLRPGADEIEEIHARFIREIAVAQKLDDPHIVAYRDCGVEDGILYFAMQYLPWGSLEDVLSQRHSLPWRETCQCGVQIAQGLQHFHDHGILHRDLKPANIFLSEDGRLKLGDFGLARDVESPMLTLAGTTVGSAYYIAPEQAIGDDSIDGRADLYALGCILFECLVGRTPFAPRDGDATVTFYEMMRRHIEDQSPRLIELAPACPPDFCRLVDRLLSKNRKERPVSAAEVTDELNRVLAETSASELSNVHSHFGDIQAVENETESLTTRLRSGRDDTQEQSTAKILMICAVVLAVVMVAAFVATMR